MSKAIIYSFALLFSFKLYAQDKSASTVKIYINTLYDKYGHYAPNPFDTSNTSLKDKLYVIEDLNLGYISAAYAFSKTPLYSHEFELSRFSYQRQRHQVRYHVDGPNNDVIIKGLKHQEFNLVTRYDILRNLYSSSSSNFSIRLGAQPYMQLNRFTPELSSEYPIRINRFGMRTNFGFSYSHVLSERFTLNTDLYSELTNLMFVQLKDQNPNISTYEQQSSTISWGAFGPYYGARLGIGYVFQPTL